MSGPLFAVPGPLSSPGTAASESARCAWEAGIGSERGVGLPPRMKRSCSLGKSCVLHAQINKKRLHVCF